MVALPAADAQIVRGQVVDSLTRRPLVHATVSLIDSTGREILSAVSDPEGLFLVRAPAAAPYRLRVESEGYVPSTFPRFQIAPNQTLAYMLLVAPTGTPTHVSDDIVSAMVERACPGATPGHPIIVGLVQDSEARPVPGARVRFAWASLPEALAQDVSISDVSGISEADSLGRYAVCGVPRASKISLHASQDDALSDFVRLEFVGNVVVRGGESAATSGPFWVEDFTLRTPAERTSELAGNVTDAQTGQPVEEVVVTIQGTELSATTDSTGAFVLSRVPAGPTRVLLRKVGTEPVVQEVTLPNDGRLELPRGMLTVGQRTELAPIMVEARPAPHPLDEFNDRRRNGQGSFITRDEWLKMGNPSRATDVLERLAGVRLEAGTDIQHRRTISMTRGIVRTFGGGAGGLDGSNCPPLYFLDRQFIGNARTVDIDATISLMDLEAIEAHGSVAAMPINFNRRGAECGVIAFWTQRAQPRTFAIEEDKGFFTSTAFHFAVAAAAVLGIFFGLGEAIHF